ncbi:MAG: lactate utilization protein C [Anaerolineales bacterium]
MSEAEGREIVLGRVQQALRTGPRLPAPLRIDLPPQPGEQSRAALIEEFKQEWEALQGKFLRMPREDAVVRLSALLRELGVRRLLAWNEEHLPMRDLGVGLERAGFRLEGAVLPRRDPARRERIRQLADLEVGLTGAAAAIAQVGALVLPGGPGRARLASLLPPIHIALLTPQQFYATFEAYLTAQTQTGASAPMLASSSSLTLVAGPSRTADIERVLTLGVHGPGDVLVVLLE